MEKRRLIALACLLLAAPLAADFVYTTDGKVYEGKATREGDRVIVQMQYGTVSLDAKDVIAIAKAEITSKPADSLPKPPPDEPMEKPFRVGDATRPEPKAFGYMRVLTTTPRGEKSLNVRKQIQYWQNAAHDRQRKVGVKWLDPQDFQIRRRVFETKNAEAEEAFQKVRRVSGSDQASETERTKLRTAAAKKARSAAQEWPDLLLRRFLTGVADYHDGQFAEAQRAFKRCRREAPLLAVFHQAYAMALLKADRPLEAVEAFTEALKLETRSRSALYQLQEAMKAVPGAKTRNEAFTAAKQLVDQYEQPTRTISADKVKWLLPGKVKQSRSSILPTLSYDRINFRQAVAVPVGANALLVDAAAVEGASKLYLRVSEDRYVALHVSRTSSSTRDKQKIPLAMLTANEVTFAPVNLAAAVQFPPNLRATVHALPLYTSMSENVANIQTITTDEDTGLPIETRLSAGDGAAPVIDEDGRLLGFLAGKIDVTAPGGGKDGFIGPEDLKSIVKRASTLKGRSDGYRSAKRTFTPERLAGDHFVIYAIECETVK